jgi:hypothetical protein
VVAYFSAYDMLEYSVELDSAFCLYVILSRIIFMQTEIILLIGDFEIGITELLHCMGSFSGTYSFSAYHVQLG